MSPNPATLAQLFPSGDNATAWRPLRGEAGLAVLADAQGPFQSVRLCWGYAPPSASASGQN